MTLRRLALSLLAASTLSGAMSCALTADDLSCTKKNATGGPERCIEYGEFGTVTGTNAKASIEVLCNGFGVGVDERKCDVTTALAGCKKNNGSWTQIDWTYPSDVDKTAADVSCNSDATKVGPDRNPL